MMKKTKYQESKEKRGWFLLAQRNIKKLWGNPQDEKEWIKYL